MSAAEIAAARAEGARWHLMPMGIDFSDGCDPIAHCLVGDCTWHGHGDSLRDATDAWLAHLAADHRGDWPDE